MLIRPGESFNIPLDQLQSSVIPLELLWVKPGTFLMGRPPEEKGYDPDVGYWFEVTISQSFWLGKYQTTQAQWQAVMGNNPSIRNDLGGDYPLENISWSMALEFCDRLNQRFSTDLPPGYRFSLPTEAQWEYACKAGTLMRYQGGDNLDDLRRVAWIKSNSNLQPHPVGQKEANAWGFHDMNGNVMEWCMDAFSLYPDIPTTDWTNLKSAGKLADYKLKIYRGGAFHSFDESFEVSPKVWNRYYDTEDYRAKYLGFRLCLRYI